MVYRNNTGRLGFWIISVCLETRWLGQKQWFLSPGTLLYRWKLTALSVRHASSRYRPVLLPPPCETFPLTSTSPHYRSAPLTPPCDSFPLTSTSPTTMGCSTCLSSAAEWVKMGSQVSCRFEDVKLLPVLTSNVHVCTCMRPSYR